MRTGCSRCCPRSTCLRSDTSSTCTSRSLRQPLRNCSRVSLFFSHSATCQIFVQEPGEQERRLKVRKLGASDISFQRLRKTHVLWSHRPCSTERTVLADASSEACGADARSPRPDLKARSSVPTRRLLCALSNFCMTT